MRVTFYGVRGSVPTPGPTTVRYGGNTVCVGVRLADGTLIILDAGTGARVLGDEILAAGVPREPMHLLVTHSHWDHIIGAPFFGPIWRKEARIFLHAMSPRAERATSRLVLFDGEHFPVAAHQIPAQLDRVITTDGRARIGSAEVSTIALNHPGGADGFRIDDADGASLCYLTDNELTPPSGLVTAPDALARFAFGCGLLIHDAQYVNSDMPAKHGWGHSVVGDVLALGRAAEARILALHHHDPWRDDAALDIVQNQSETWARENAPKMRVLVASEGLSLDIR